MTSLPIDPSPDLKDKNLHSYAMEQGEIDVDSFIRDDLSRFVDKVWGKPQALSDYHSSGGFEYINLGEFLNSFRALLGGAVENKILVRDEYRVAVQELQTDGYSRGAYVTGHPGIGKTLFLIYLLIRLLGQRCKVAMHDTNHQFCVFFTNTVAFYPLNSSTLLAGGPMFALSDSGVRETPPVCFYQFPRIRLIQATFPEKRRWHEWTKQMGAKNYVMDIWTAEETANLAKLRNYNVQQMLDLGEKWGGDPRTLVSYVKSGMSSQEIESWYRNRAKVAIQKCWNIVSAAVNRAPEGWDVLSRFYFCRPADHASLNINHTKTCVTIPTHTICYILGEALQTFSSTGRLDFFNTLTRFSETQQAAGFIYQSWFNAFFATANKFIDCHWLTELGTVTKLRAAPLLTSSNGRDIQARMELPYYWTAGSNYPGIDGALVRKDAIYVFQIAFGLKRSSPQTDVQKLRQVLPAELKDLPWHVIFVGNAEYLVRTVAREWVGKVFLTETSQTPVPIAWSEVDPVAEDITYRVCSLK